MKEINLNYQLRNEPFPRNVVVEVCGYCNLRCKMCPYPGLKRAKGMMKEEIFKRIIDNIAENDKSATVWPAQMGEPLMFGEYIFSLIDYATRKGVPVILNTNGMLIDKNINRIVSSELEEVIVGIDGATKQTYENVRRGADFDHVVNNVNLLLKERPKKLKVAVQFIPSEENEQEEEIFKEYWLERGAIVKLRRKIGWGSAVDTDLKKMQVKRVACPWLMRTAMIHWDGSVVQCGSDHEGEYSVGNISERSLFELWNGPLKERREKHLNNNYEFEPCMSCSDWACGISEWYYPDEAD